jgi:uncharacterized DUF497 family protein
MPAPLLFAFDPAKARSNLHKHEISFAEAITVFRDPLAVTIADDVHSQEENREITCGLSERSRILIVVHTEEVDGRLRILSARRATAHEQRDYEG